MVFENWVALVSDSLQLCKNITERLSTSSPGTEHRRRLVDISHRAVARHNRRVRALLIPVVIGDTTSTPPSCTIPIPGEHVILEYHRERRTLLVESVIPLINAGDNKERIVLSTLAPP